MEKILVLGAYGLLGCSLSAELKAAGLPVLRQGRRAEAELRFDPLDPAKLAAIIADRQVRAVVNLVAATDVDLCERDCTLAFTANVRAVNALGAAIAALPPDSRPHVVQLSTDQVYQGTGPHAEQDALPCNVYGLSKYAGELAAERLGATVLRTNFYGRSRCAGRASFTDWIFQSLRAGREIPVFDDVRIGALHMRTLCAAIRTAIARPQPGVFNLGCADGASKADIAFRLAGLLGLDASKMRRTSVAEAKLAAPRPLDMTMDCSRFAASFGFTPPTTDSQIILAAKEYDHA